MPTLGQTAARRCLLTTLGHGKDFGTSLKTSMWHEHTSDSHITSESKTLVLENKLVLCKKIC